MRRQQIGIPKQSVHTSPLGVASEPRSLTTLRTNGRKPQRTHTTTERALECVCVCVCVGVRMRVCVCPRLFAFAPKSRGQFPVRTQRTPPNRANRRPVCVSVGSSGFWAKTLDTLLFSKDRSSMVVYVNARIPLGSRDLAMVKAVVSPRNWAHLALGFRLRVFTMSFNLHSFRIFTGHQRTGTETRAHIFTRARAHAH